MANAIAQLATLQAAVIAALKAFGALTSLLDSTDAVYDGKAPNPTTGAQPTKYVVVRSPGNVPTGVFGSVGSDNVLEIHIWHPGRIDAPVLAIAAQIAEALDGVRLTMTGVRHWTGSTLLVGVLDDNQATPALKHGVIRYEARTQ